MEAERILTAKSFVVDFFEGDAREAMRNQGLYLQKPGRTPFKPKEGVVHATQDDWSHIVSAARECNDGGHLIVKL